MMLDSEYTTTTLKKIRLGGIGLCFFNSIRLAKREGLIYCEGYAWCSLTSFASLHGWCIDKNGNVYDPTWPDGLDYFGVVIDLGDAVERRKASGWQSVLDSPRDCPVITDNAVDWRYTGVIAGVEERDFGTACAI